MPCKNCLKLHRLTVSCMVRVTCKPTASGCAPTKSRPEIDTPACFAQKSAGKSLGAAVRCTVPTTYPNAAQRKVFIQERLASLLLSVDGRWRVKAADPFGFGWSMTRFRQFPHEAVLSDALKTAFLKTGFPEYLRAYSEIRARFAAGAQAA